MGEKSNAYRILVGKPEGKRPLGRPRCKWVDNIEIDLRKDMVVWTELVCLQIRTNEDGNEPSGSIKYLEILE
jgi:hypothetical protein